MTHKAYLPLEGRKGCPAIVDSGYPAKPGDKVWLVNCHDRLTGTTTPDTWIVPDNVGSLEKLTANLNSFANDLIFSFQGEHEIKADEMGRLYIELEDNPPSR